MQVLSKTVSPLWFYAYKKYKNGNSARRTASQRHIRPSICYGGSDNFSSGISGKLPKIQLQTLFSLEQLILWPRNFARQFRRSSSMTYFKTLFILVALLSLLNDNKTNDLMTLILKIAILNLVSIRCTT